MASPKDSKHVVDKTNVHFNQLSKNDKNQLRKSYQEDVKNFHRVNEQIARLEKDTTGIEHKSMPALRETLAALEGRLEKYYSVMFSAEEPLPSFITQKDLMTWLQHAAKNINSTKDKRQLATQKENFNRYFSNPFFLDRLILGKGSGDYSAKHDVYFSAAEKFIPALFNFTSKENDAIGFKDSSFLSSARGSIYQYLTNPPALYTQMDAENVNKLKLIVGSHLESEWSKPKEMLRDASRNFSELARITNPKNTLEMQEIIFDALHKKYLEIIRVRKETDQARIKEEEAKAYIAEIQAKSLAQEGQAKTHHNEVKIKVPTEEENARAKEEDDILALLNLGWENFVKIAEMKPAENKEATFTVGNNTNLSKMAYDNLHAALVAGSKGVWAETPYEQLDIQKKVLMDRDINDLKKLDNRTQEQEEELKRLEAFAQTAESSMPEILRSIGGSPLKESLEKSHVNLNEMVGSGPFLKFLLTTPPRLSFVDLKDLAHLVVQHSEMVLELLGKNKDQLLEVLFPLENGVRNDKVLAEIKNYYKQQEKLKAFGGAVSGQVTMLGSVGQHSAVKMETVDLVSVLENSLKSLEEKKVDNQAATDQYHYTGDYKASYLEFQRDVANNDDEKSKAQSKKMFDMLASYKDKLLPPDVKQKHILFLIKYNMGLVEKLPPRSKSDASKKIAEIFNDPNVCLRVLLGKGSENYTDRLHKHRYFEDASRFIAQLFGAQGSANETFFHHANVKANIIKFFMNAQNLDLEPNEKEKLKQLQQVMGQSAERHWKEFQGKIEEITDNIIARDLTDEEKSKVIANRLGVEYFVKENALLNLESGDIHNLLPVIFSVPKPRFVDDETLATMIVYYPVPLQAYFHKLGGLENIFVSNGEKSRKILDLAEQIQRDLVKNSMTGGIAISWDESRLAALKKFSDDFANFEIKKAATVIKQPSFEKVSNHPLKDGVVDSQQGTKHSQSEVVSAPINDASSKEVKPNIPKPKPVKLQSDNVNHSKVVSAPMSDTSSKEVKRNILKPKPVKLLSDTVTRFISNLIGQVEGIKVKGLNNPFVTLKKAKYTSEDVRKLYANILMAKESAPKPGIFNRLYNFFFKSKQLTLVLNRMQNALEAEFPGLRNEDKAALRSQFKTDHKLFVPNKKPENPLVDLYRMHLGKKVKEQKPEIKREEGIELSQSSAYRKQENSQPSRSPMLFARGSDIEMLRKDLSSRCDRIHHEVFDNKAFESLSSRGQERSLARNRMDIEVLEDIAKRAKLISNSPLDQSYSKAMEKMQERVRFMEGATRSYRSSP